MGGKVKHVTSEAEWNSERANAGGKLIVVDFFAQWCGPCKKIAPYIEQLSNELSDVVFLKVDVDELPDIAAKEDIKAMPTFRFYKGGQTVGELVGASQTKLKELIDAKK